MNTMKRSTDTAIFWALLVVALVGTAMYHEVHGVFPPVLAWADAAFSTLSAYIEGF